MREQWQPEPPQLHRQQFWMRWPTQQLWKPVWLQRDGHPPVDGQLLQKLVGHGHVAAAATDTRVNPAAAAPARAVPAFARKPLRERFSSSQLNTAGIVRLLSRARGSSGRASPRVFGAHPLSSSTSWNVLIRLSSSGSVWPDTSPASMSRLFATPFASIRPSRYIKVNGTDSTPKARATAPSGSSTVVVTSSARSIPSGSSPSPAIAATVVTSR